VCPLVTAPESVSHSCKQIEWSVHMCQRQACSSVSQHVYALWSVADSIQVLTLPLLFSIYASLSKCAHFAWFLTFSARSAIVASSLLNIAAHVARCIESVFAGNIKNRQKVFVTIGHQTRSAMPTFFGQPDSEGCTQAELVAGMFSRVGKNATQQVWRQRCVHFRATICTIAYRRAF
jgi:hypothetical protein